jgi:hypothetical protein
MYKIHEVLKRTDWTKLSQQKTVIQRTMGVLQSTEFEEKKVHLDDLFQWIEQIEKCAEAAGYTATYPYCLQAARRYVLT